MAENANTYSETLFGFSVDKQLFGCYDAYTNSCSQRMFDMEGEDYDEYSTDDK